LANLVRGVHVKTFQNSAFRKLTRQNTSKSTHPFSHPTPQKNTVSKPKLVKDPFFTKFPKTHFPISQCCHIIMLRIAHVTRGHTLGASAAIGSMLTNPLSKFHTNCPFKFQTHWCKVEPTTSPRHKVHKVVHFGCTISGPKIVTSRYLFGHPNCHFSKSIQENTSN